MERRVPPPGWSQLSHPRESEGDGSGQQVLSGGMPPIVSKGTNLCKDNGRLDGVSSDVRM